MKKIIAALSLILGMGIFLTACGGNSAQNTSETAQTASAEDSANITVTTINSKKEPVEVEVPKNPKKIAVLDMAVLDMLDSWELGDSVVGMPKASRVDYLTDYNDNENIVNLGTLKEVDMEALMSTQPDIIFIGGRLLEQYDELSKIAPVVVNNLDYKKGSLQSTKDNAQMISSIFGLESKAKEQTDAFDSRIEKLKEAAQGKTAVIGMVTSSNFSTLGNGSRGSLISNEIGFEHLAKDVDSTHGNESSFELLVEQNPNYIFVLDRDSAINADGAKLAKDIMNNELVNKTEAAQNNQIVYLTPTAWYLAEGGVQAMDVMLKDLENALLK